jgi:hypothetical protein
MVYQTSKGINRSTKDLIDKEGAAKRKEAQTIGSTLAIQGPAGETNPLDTQVFVSKWKELKAQVKSDKKEMLQQAKEQKEEALRLKEEALRLKEEEKALKKQQELEHQKIKDEAKKDLN